MLRNKDYISYKISLLKKIIILGNKLKNFTALMSDKIINYALESISYKSIPKLIPHFNLPRAAINNPSRFIH